MRRFSLHTSMLTLSSAGEWRRALLTRFWMTLPSWVESAVTGSVAGPSTTKEMFLSFAIGTIRSTTVVIDDIASTGSVFSS